MARTALTLNECVRAGVNATYADAATDGHAFDNQTERVILHVKNASTDTTLTVTVQTPKTVDGLAVTDLTVAVPNAAERFIGPFPNDVYGKNDTTLSIKKAVWVDYSDTGSDYKIAAVKVPQAIYA